ncbi:hypothetical protein [Curtobacterium sp. TXMA1]|uniref:hypothetical protein n=1 Tax=Curtobacterium sp. TXMA1 TaxID=2876939 RepID=UPI001CCF0CE9|nr:hypothetical protein [Curtobacterium sp. TXMA1]UBQ02749.1 hypothetical protein LCG91_00835 [Curtobacterium sp. TXMA1]
MTVKITLPRLVGTREAADRIVGDSIGQGVREDNDRRVLVLSRALAASTISFADELVSKLEQEGFNEILVVGAPEEFTEQLSQATSRRTTITWRKATSDELALA